MNKPKYKLVFQTITGQTLKFPISSYWEGSKRLVFSQADGKTTGELITPNVCYWYVIPWEMEMYDEDKE